MPPKNTFQSNLPFIENDAERNYSGDKQMAVKKQIPDVAYEIDGDTVTVEQGWSEPTSVVLHKIHLKHLAEEMGVRIDDGQEAGPKLVAYLEDINKMANELYQMLADVPTFPPGNEVTEDVLLAHDLAEKAKIALALWGNN